MQQIKPVMSGAVVSPPFAGFGQGTYPIPDPVVVGAGDVLSDGDDSTYVVVGKMHDFSVGTDSDYITIPMETLTSDTDSFQMTWHYRLATSHQPDSDPNADAIFAFALHDPDYNVYFEITNERYVSNGSLVFDVFTDYDGTFSAEDADHNGVSLDDLKTLLMSGTAQVDFYEYGSSGGQWMLAEKVAEFSLGDPAKASRGWSVGVLGEAR